MFSKLLLTILLSCQFFLPSAAQNGGKVLNMQMQNAGDKIVTKMPQKINPNDLNVEIFAKAGIVVDKETNKILFAKNIYQMRPLASITKLMTAMVFLDTQPDLEKEVEITHEDLSGIGKANLLLGEKVKLKNLLYLSLIASDNHATLTLVRASGIPKNKFIQKMNIKAKKLGFSKTHFADPVGLAKENVSTPYEVAQILKSCSYYSLIKKILSLKSYRFTSLSGERHYIKSTNKLFGSYLNVLGGKTGYTDEAGYCFTGIFKLSNGREVISVILGAPADKERFNDTKRIVSWVSENYLW